MPTTPLEFTAPSGLTLTADLVDPSDDSIVIDDGAATEQTNAKGQYRIDHTGSETGVHLLVISTGSAVIGRAWVDIEADDTNVYRAVASYVEALRLDASVSDIWTTALTEAYRSTGATGTAAQLLYEILAHLGEFAISGTTKTAKQLDGSTTAKTYTLDDASNPTSITEAT